MDIENLILVALLKRGAFEIILSSSLISLWKYFNTILPFSFILISIQSWSPFYSCIKYKWTWFIRTVWISRFNILKFVIIEYCFTSHFQVYSSVHYLRQCFFRSFMILKLPFSGPYQKEYIFSLDQSRKYRNLLFFNFSIKAGRF